MKWFNTCCFVIACVVASVNSLFAEEGDPVAIRLWPDGGVTIETMWNLHVGIGVTDGAKRLLPRELDFDLSQMKGGDAITLQRLPNQDAISILPDFPNSADSSSLHASKTDFPKINPEGADGSWSFDVSVDDVDITNLNAADPATMANTLDTMDTHLEKLQSRDLERNLGVHALIACKASYDEATILQLVRIVSPRVVIVHPSLTKIGSQKVTAIPHNTLAVSAATNEKQKRTRFVSLTNRPYELPPKVAELFKKKEAACKASRETFAKLSIEQMNFQPSNGTHTPRWNSEHMMGRELLFFSQIYHAVDPAIPVMDLNPRQMPKEYEMAHPDWIGAEEARQTERVEAFTRRYAYLLDGMPLNQKAKGSKFWTPRALLKQMERHYNEHTSNVRKKMSLDEWPKQ